MFLRSAVKEGEYFRRSSWENETFYIYIECGVFKTYDEDPIQEIVNGSEFNLDLEDILGDDWEVIEKKKEPEELHLLDIEISTGEGTIYFNSQNGFHATENDIDEILTFLYNNTEIGKSRIIPF